MLCCLVCIAYVRVCLGVFGVNAFAVVWWFEMGTYLFWLCCFCLLVVCIGGSFAGFVL